FSTLSMGEFSSIDSEIRDGRNPGASEELIERLSNFPFVFHPQEDVKYIEEVQTFLKDDKGDFLRFIHGFLLSSGRGWDIQDLKGSMRESYGFDELSEVDKYVEKCFNVKNFHEFIESDWTEGVVRLEEESGRIFPFVDESNREIFEDAKKCMHKEEKERRKSKKNERTVDVRENVETRTTQMVERDERRHYGSTAREGEDGGRGTREVQKKTRQTDPRATPNAVKPSSSEEERNEFDDSPDEVGYSDDEDEREKGSKRKKKTREETKRSPPSADQGLARTSRVNALPSSEPNEFDESPDEVMYSDEDDEENNAKRVKAFEMKKKKKEKEMRAALYGGFSSTRREESNGRSSATSSSRSTPLPFQPTMNKWDEEAASPKGGSVQQKQPRQAVDSPRQSPQMASYPQQQKQTAQQGWQAQQQPAYPSQMQQSVQPTQQVKR
ncbi:hypothetical protein PMAYCL1PPCAC_28849, partial [Pristionchus mayeri]